MWKLWNEGVNKMTNKISVKLDEKEMKIFSFLADTECMTMEELGQLLIKRYIGDRIEMANYLGADTNSEKLLQFIDTVYSKL